MHGNFLKFNKISTIITLLFSKERMKDLCEKFLLKITSCFLMITIIIGLFIPIHWFGVFAFCFILTIILFLVLIVIYLICFKRGKNVELKLIIGFSIPLIIGIIISDTVLIYELPVAILFIFLSVIYFFLITNTYSNKKLIFITLIFLSIILCFNSFLNFIGKQDIYFKKMTLENIPYFVRSNYGVFFKKTLFIKKGNNIFFQKTINELINFAKKNPNSKFADDSLFLVSLLLISYSYEVNKDKIFDSFLIRNIEVFIEKYPKCQIEQWTKDGILTRSEFAIYRDLQPIDVAQYHFIEYLANYEKYKEAIKNCKQLKDRIKNRSFSIFLLVNNLEGNYCKKLDSNIVK